MDARENLAEIRSDLKDSVDKKRGLVLNTGTSCGEHILRVIDLPENCPLANGHIFTDPMECPIYSQATRDLSHAEAVLDQVLDVS